MNRLLCVGIGLAFLVCGCSEEGNDAGDERAVGSSSSESVEEADTLVLRFEAGEWDAWDGERQRIYREFEGESRRMELLRLHKRALAVDFKKIEDRIRREWVEEDSNQGDWFILPKWTVEQECNRVMAFAYSSLGRLTTEVGVTFWFVADYSQEMWDVWFDYIEKMIAENHRLNRDRLFGCEDAIRQIEEYRTVQFGGGTPQLDKDVDEWLHEKFLRLVGRPMANGK